MNYMEIIKRLKQCDNYLMTELYNDTVLEASWGIDEAIKIIKNIAEIKEVFSDEEKKSKS